MTSREAITSKKKNIIIRQIPHSQVAKFERDLAMYPWEEILTNESANNQAVTFNSFLQNKLEHYFPEKNVKISSLDKKWFSPSLKQLHRRTQRAFHRNRSSKNTEH